MIYAILWKFHARDGKSATFERAYGPTGVWAQFFRQGEGYVGTELHRDVSDDTKYITIDRWSSPAAYESFRESNLPEYDKIDQQCESLTTSETPIGYFETMEASQ